MIEINSTYKMSFQKFRSNAIAKPIQRRIHVKSEPGIPAQSVKTKAKGKFNVVKVEMNTPKQQSKKIVLQEEKQTFIDKVVLLKSQNQQILLQLRTEQSKNASLKSELQKMKRENNTKSVEVKTLRSKLSEESAKHTEICAQKETKISNLLHEKRLLEARNKQLQCGVDQQKIVKEAHKNENADADDEVYEVEKLVGHKMVRFYLVRWKGYTEEHDTWEKETNLIDCPEILKSYKSSIANEKK